MPDICLDCGGDAEYEKRCVFCHPDPLTDPTPARTVGENVVRLVHLRNGQFYHPILSDLDHTHVAFPKDEAAEILRLAAWAREVAALMHIGLERPPEEVFEHFRRELGIEAPDAI